MKRIIAVLMLVTMIISFSATAFAYTYSVAIPSANTYKGGSYETRVASGSFWKATFKSSPSTSVRSTTAYLYRRGHDRCTKIENFNLQSARTGLNYFSGQNVTGDQYKLVAKSGNVSGRYVFYFNP